MARSISARPLPAHQIRRPRSASPRQASAPESGRRVAAFATLAVVAAMLFGIAADRMMYGTPIVADSPAAHISVQP